MTITRSILLFALAALFEIGGAWLVWQGWREHRGLWWIAAGVIALGLYGFVATFRPDPHFGRILAAYGGVFVAGSLAWGVIVDKFRPDRYDIIGATICLIGVAVIMCAPTTLKGILAFAESPSHRQTQLRTLEHGQPGATEMSQGGRACCVRRHCCATCMGRLRRCLRLAFVPARSSLP